MLVFRTSVEFGLSNQDLGDFCHLCQLDSIDFAQFKPISYIFVGRILIPFLGHFRTTESVTDRRRSDEMQANHGVTPGKAFLPDRMVNSIALEHIYSLYIASGRTCSEFHERQSQFSHSCVVSREGVYMSLYAPDWGSKWEDLAQLVPSNSL